MKNHKELINNLCVKLSGEIKSLPVSKGKDIFNGSEYIFSDKGVFYKRSHSLMISIITKCLWDLLDNDEFLVEIEPQFNYKYLDEENCKFNPDIAIYRVNKEELEPIEKSTPFLFIDYESPNSSDARVMLKDIEPYMYFSEHLKEIENIKTQPIYLIITSHRNYEAEKNDLNRVLAYGYNDDFRKDKYEIHKNPLSYWLAKYFSYISEWKSELWSIDEIFIANVCGEDVDLCAGVIEADI